MPLESGQHVLVLVNGHPGSAGGTRARGLFEPLQNQGRVDYFYRDFGKIASLRYFFQKISRLKPNLVYVIDTAISGAGAALLARCFRGIPYIVDTGDLGYELAELTGTPGWAGRKMIGFVEASALHLASAIVVRGTFHKEILNQDGFHNVSVIRDGIGAGQPDSMAVSHLRRTLGLEGFLCVGMMGSIKMNPRTNLCYGWDLVEALGALDLKLPVRGLIVGDGDGLPVLRQRAKILGIEERVNFAGRVSYDQVSAYLGVMDVALSTQTNNRVGQVRTTGKLPEYMAAGCYVLATDVGEARLLLPSEMRLPYQAVKDLEYPARLAAKITRLAEANLRELDDAVAATQKLAQNELTYSYLSRQLDQVLQSVLKVYNKKHKSLK